MSMNVTKMFGFPPPLPLEYSNNVSIQIKQELVRLIKMLVHTTNLPL